MGKKFISVRDKINARLDQSLPGSILFVQDFFGEASGEAVRQQLSRLVKEGVLVRLSQGLYVSPKKTNGYGSLLPAAPEIANAIARRDKAKIIPTGEVALSQLGLSEQVPLNFVYLTDGPARVINIDVEGKKGYSIRFKHAGPKNFAFTGKISSQVIQALRALGKKDLDDVTLDKIKSLLMRENQGDLKHDIALAPAWISKLILNLLQTGKE